MIHNALDDERADKNPSEGALIWCLVHYHSRRCTLSQDLISITDNLSQLIAL